MREIRAEITGQVKEEMVAELEVYRQAREKLQQGDDTDAKDDLAGRNFNCLY